MSPVPSSPPLTMVAEAVQDLLDPTVGPSIVGVAFDDTGFDVALWSIPRAAGDPLDALIGHRAWPGFDLLGFSATLSDDAALPDPWAPAPPGNRVTLLMDRWSDGVVIAGDAGHHELTDVAAGCTGDALRRCLGLPTPPPDRTSAAWVDAVWLHLIAEAACHGDRSLDWPALATLHPLADGPEAEPGELHERTAVFVEQLPWDALRQRWTGRDRRDLHPPGGTTVDERDWFDEGSFARSHLRRVPAAAASVADLTLVLPEHLVQAVITAMHPSVW